MRDALQFDRRAISLQGGLLAAIPVAAVLALGTAVWSSVAGVTMGAGAMLVGIAWRVAGGRPPLALLATDATVMAMSTFVGCLTGSILWLHFGLLAVWALAGGLLVALGNRGGVIGTQAMIAFVVFGRFSQPAAASLALAGLVLAGGFAQVVFQAVVRWPTPLRWQRSGYGQRVPSAGRPGQGVRRHFDPADRPGPRRGAGEPVVADAVRGSGADDAAEPGQRRASNADPAEHDPRADEPPPRRRSRRRRRQYARSGRGADPRARCGRARSRRPRDRGRPRRACRAPGAHREAELGHRGACTDAGCVRAGALAPARGARRAAPRGELAGGHRRRGQRPARSPPPRAHEPAVRAGPGRSRGAPRQRQPPVAGGPPRRASRSGRAHCRADLATPAAQPELLDGGRGRHHAPAGVRCHLHPRRRAGGGYRSRCRTGRRDRGRAPPDRCRDRRARRRARMGGLRRVSGQLRARVRVHHRGRRLPAERDRPGHTCDRVGAPPRHARRRHARPARVRTVADLVICVRAPVAGRSGAGGAGVRERDPGGDRGRPPGRRAGDAPTQSPREAGGPPQRRTSRGRCPSRRRGGSTPSRARDRWRRRAGWSWRPTC